MKISLLMCEVFGHKMYFDSCNVAGPSTCKRCGHKQEGIRWPAPPMPVIKTLQHPNSK